MKVFVLYDVDGTRDIVIKGHHITTQLFHDGGTAMIRVFNKRGKLKATHHFAKTYYIESIP